MKVFGVSGFLFAMFAGMYAVSQSDYVFAFAAASSLMISVATIVIAEIRERTAPLTKGDEE